MIILKTGLELSILLEKITCNGTIGYVPTMGALHEGHLSLIKKCKSESTFTVCSIFVNPTQFNDKSDFEKYPVKLEEDIALLIQAGCDILFLPNVKELYPDGTTLETYNLGALEIIWEGKFRPGHFQGVCQVVQRLLSIIKPNKLFMGQKDYQQCMIIQQLIHLIDFKTELVICSTIREASGLAMSSRNVRLSLKGKTAAVAIFDSMQYVKDNLSSNELENIKAKVTSNLMINEFSSIDYIAICNALTLESLTKYDSSVPVVVMIAAFIDGVRLIDNMLISH